MRASGDHCAGVREEEPERDNARSQPEERPHPAAGITGPDEQGTGRPYGQVDRMRHQLGGLLDEARSRKIGREQPGDPAGDTGGEQDYRVDRTGDRGCALTEMDNGAWRLDRGEPGPRSGPALRGFGPLLQRLGRRPSRSPDPVKMLPSPELVTRSPVPDGHALPHGSCPSPAQHPIVSLSTP